MQSSTPMQRIALCVEYDGSAFSGWQTQLNPRLRTVQETLEQALGSIADHCLTTICAGRTDAGVHATGQIVHFDTTSARPLKAWTRGSNSRLPDQVSVHWACAVPSDFHARFSATSRRYRYCIYNAETRPAMLSSFVTVIHQKLDAGAMHEAGQALLGENDFSAYRAAGCQSKTPMRNLHSISVHRRGHFVIIDVEANAFLLHMVRNMAGVLIEIGAGRRSRDWAGELLQGRDRTLAAVTAPPQGLCLYAVQYPARFDLPQPPPYFLPVAFDSGSL